MVAAPAPRTRSRHGYHPTELERAQTRRNYAEIAERGVASLAHAGPAVEGLCWSLIFYSLYRAARSITRRQARQGAAFARGLFASLVNSVGGPFVGILTKWVVGYDPGREMAEAAGAMWVTAGDDEEPALSHVDALIVAASGVIGMKTAIAIGERVAKSG